MVDKQHNKPPDAKGLTVATSIHPLREKDTNHRKDKKRKKKKRGGERTFFIIQVQQTQTPQAPQTPDCGFGFTQRESMKDNSHKMMHVSRLQSHRMKGFKIGLHSSQYKRL